MLRDSLSSFLILDSAPPNFQLKIKETFHTNSVLACISSTFNLVDIFIHIFFSHIFFSLVCSYLLQRVSWVLLTRIWKQSNFPCNICGCWLMLDLFGQVRSSMLRQGSSLVLFSILNISQKMSFKYCDRLAWAFKCWANNAEIMLCWNVAIVWPRLRALLYLHVWPRVNESGHSQTIATCQRNISQHC